MDREGATYRSVSDSVRRDRALDLLRAHRCSVQEVAFLTGFSDVAAFHRPFKRWTGATPLAYRHSPYHPPPQAAPAQHD